MTNNEWVNRFNIVSIKGHFEVYDGNKFLCSTDTFTEAAEEAERYLDRIRNEAAKNSGVV